MSQIDDLKAELELLKKQFLEQRAELVVAQEKRSGHYKKLEYQIEINKKLREEIEDLRANLANKNQDFLFEIVAEKYDFIDQSLETLLKKYNELVLSTKVLEEENGMLAVNNDALKEELGVLRVKFATLQEEARIAQEKRSGHYAKLEISLQKNDELEKRVGQLTSALDHNKKSLTWLLGEVLLSCKTFKGLLLFPVNIVRANKKFREYQATRVLSAPIKVTTNNVTERLKNATVDTNASYSVNQNTTGVDITILGWPKPNNDKSVTIMTVADAFTTSNLKSVANLITPRPDNWRGLLNRDQPALLFVESAWNGNENSWQYRVGSYANPPGKELFEMVAEFKKKGLPTIFWNKEDPVHFDKFKNAAKEFDYIFTSDEGSIPAYQKMSQAKIFALPFAADSSVNNPINSVERQDRVCFAGSYYANRFIERRNDQLMLLESALPYGLDIYDRNAGNINKDFHFPNQFAECIRGSLSYEQMNKAYKQYKVFLNVNSVIDSKTMFSRRVFELLASGTPIVSTPSLGIEEFFGSDLVWIVKNKDEAKEAIETLLRNQQEWRRRSLVGIRKVFSEHTFQERFDSILNIVGVNEPVNKVPKILCCMEAHQQSDIDTLKAVIMNQYTANKIEMLPFIILRDKRVSTELPNIINDSLPVFQIIQQYLKQNPSIKFASLFSDKNLYGRYYLLDLYLSTLYANTQIISKPKQDSYSYADSFLATASLVSRDVLMSDKFVSPDDGQESIKTPFSVFLGDSANFSRKIGNLNDLLAKIEI